LDVSFRSKDTDHDRSFRLRASLTLRKISIFTYLEAWAIPHHILRCAWCGDFNHDIIGIDHIVNNGYIIPTGVRRRHSAPYLCFSKHTCKSKTLNKNSVEFISKAYGLTTEAALEKLHSRSQSPFYKENHKTTDDYRKSQSRSPAWFETHNKDRNEWINKANHSRSHQGYIDNNVGDSWYTVQQSKAITLENLIQRYGTNDGHIRHAKWKEGTNASINTYIKKYGKIAGTEHYLKARIHVNSENTNSNLFEDFIVKISTIVVEFPIYQYHMFNLDTVMRFYKFYEVAKDFFGVTTADIECKLIDILPDYRMNCRKIFKNAYSSYSYTDHGTILKSFNEIKIYDYLKSKGLHEYTDFIINGKYPNSTLLYDIYFPSIDVYIEVAGGDSQLYIDHMTKKEQLFGSIILDPKNFKTTLTDIVNRIVKNECK
jgi:hypothetical protein